LFTRYLVEPSTSGIVPSVRNSRRNLRSHHSHASLPHSHGSHDIRGTHRNLGEPRRRQVVRCRRRSPYRRDRTWQDWRRPFPLRQERNADWAKRCWIAENQPWVSWTRMRFPSAKDPVRPHRMPSRRQPGLCECAS